MEEEEEEEERGGMWTHGVHVSKALPRVHMKYICPNIYLDKFLNIIKHISIHFGKFHFNII